MQRFLLACVLAMLGACSAPSVEGDAGLAGDAFEPTIDAAAVDASDGTGSTMIGPSDRRAHLIAPTTVTAPAPLLVLLHGYGASGAVEDAYLGVSRAAATRGLYVLTPDGTVDANGSRYWNAPNCCDFAMTPVDDVAYLTGLVRDAIAARPIDPSRVYFFGHSNGGFMSYHLACTSSDQIAAIAVLAGSEGTNASDCMPHVPVSVLHLHGTADTTVAYAGGNVGLGMFPGALEVTSRWAMRDGCATSTTMGAMIDMESTVAGAETTPIVYASCPSGLDVGLLSIAGGSHIPNFVAGVIGTQVLDWLLMHHR